MEMNSPLSSRKKEEESKESLMANVVGDLEGYVSMASDVVVFDARPSIRPPPSTSHKANDRTRVRECG